MLKTHPVAFAGDLRPAEGADELQRYDLCRPGRLLTQRVITTMQQRTRHA